MPWWYYKGKITKPVNNGENVVIIKPGDTFEAPVSAVADLKRINLVVDITKKVEIKLLREKRKKERLKALEEKKKAQQKKEIKNKEKEIENNYNKIKTEEPRRKRPRRSKKSVPEKPVEVELEENKDQSIVVVETATPEEQSTE